MKNLKLLFFGLFFMAMAVIMATSCSTVTAQTISGAMTMKSTDSHVATDTITDATVETQYANVGFNKSKVSVQSTLTKISGTVAGVMTLEASLDGDTYKRINTTDSLVLTDVASQSKIFTVSDNLWKYYRVKVTPTGTQSVKMNSIALWKRE